MSETEKMFHLTENDIIAGRVGDCGNAYNNVVAILLHNPIETKQLKKQILKNQDVVKYIIERIDELRKMLESNGDTDLQLEYELLHKIIDRKLPEDYEAL